MILGTYRSPLTPLNKGGTRVKVPFLKGDLGGSKWKLPIMPFSALPLDQVEPHDGQERHQKINQSHQKH
ncbi:hypothetical protein FJR05_18575 [Dolichospermum sp. UHCC 0259]|nr:hypothetical protein [Dolichospermum sp. UHCC 0259]